MSDKILVTYASRLGSTAGVAEAIGKTLKDNGAQVEVQRMEDVTDVTPYAAVVAGSAIYAKQMAARSDSVHADPSSGVAAEAFRSISGVHVAGYAKR